MSKRVVLLQQRTLVSGPFILYLFWLRTVDQLITVFGVKTTAMFLLPRAQHRILQETAFDRRSK